MLNKNILSYIAKNPTAKAKDVAKACGVKTHTVYNAKYYAKKHNRLPLTALAFEVKKAKAVISNAEIRNKLATMPTDIVTTHHTDMVNQPPHYKTGGIETIDFIEAKNLDYNLGNVVKYITRADHKGDRHEDLCKARWYLNRAIASVSNNA
jgi:hypothetical protein